MSEIFPESPLTSLSAVVAAMGALPVPVGPQPQPLPSARLAEAEERGAHLYEFGGDATADEWNRLAGDDVPALVKEIRRQAAEIAELNESVSTSAEALRANAVQSLPWAHVMPDADLSMFLDDLVSAAMNRWRTDPDGSVPDRVTLADIERVCREWRTPGEGFRSDPGPGVAPALVDEDDCPCAPSDRPEPHEVDCPLVDAPCPVDGPLPGAGPDSPEMRALRAGLYASPERPVNALTDVFMPVASLRELPSREEPHDSPLHHPYLKGHDLPDLGGGA